MTNTTFIGQVVGSQTADRLSAHIGYKVVGLWTGSEDGKIKLVPPHYHKDTFELSDESKCTGHKDFSSCSCGFYAYDTIESALTHWKTSCGGYSNLAIIQVALSGHVVVAEHGFRASHQRTKRILMPHCWNCSAAGVNFIYHENKFLVAGCEVCSEGIDSISFADFSAESSPQGFLPLEILSAADLGKEAEGFLAPETISATAKEAINKLVTLGRLDLLDEVILHANNKLGEGLGL